VDTGTGFIKSQSSAAAACLTVIVPILNSVGSVQAYTEKDESLTVWVWENHPRHLLIRGSGANNDAKSYAPLCIELLCAVLRFLLIVLVMQTLKCRHYCNDRMKWADIRRNTGLDTASQYDCLFESLHPAGSGATRIFSPAGPALNSTALRCPIPTWPQSEAAVISVFQHPATSLQGQNLTRLPFTGAGTESTILFKSFWTHLEPLATVAKGGGMLTLTGRGFRAEANYTCRFRARGGATLAVEAMLQAQFSNGSAQLAPRFVDIHNEREAASVTCSGTCPCGSHGALSGSISDGPGDYGNSRQTCSWLVASSYRTNITISFSSFDTESDYDFVTINECSLADCATRRQLARLSGSAVSASTVYISSTGFLEVVFTSDDSVTGAGFEASWTAGTDSQWDNLTRVACMVPPLASHVTAEVVLLEEGQVLALLNASFGLVTLLQGWDNYFFAGSSGDPTRSVINVSGYGFQASSHYWCELVDQSSRVVAFQVPAVVTNSQLLQCGRVSQRDVESARTLTITVWVNDEDNATVQREDNATASYRRVPFTNRGMTIQDESAACSGGIECRISVTPTLPTPPPVQHVWRSLHPKAVYAQGGQNITIFGTRFEGNGQYRCEFGFNASKTSLTNKSGVEHKREMNTKDFDSQCIHSCDKNFEGEKALQCKLDCAGHWYYLSGRVLNDSAMICTSSKWLHQQALLHVTIWRILHDDGRGNVTLVLIPHSGPAMSKHVLFTAGWVSIWRILHDDGHGNVTRDTHLQGPAAGGTRLHIQGYGLAVSHDSTHLSSGTLSVSRGEAPYALDCDGTCVYCSECTLLGISNESNFAECKLQCQPIDVTYACLFSRQATEDRHEWMVTGAIASTSEDLLCITPPWGTEFSSGLVSVLILETSNGLSRLLPLDQRCSMPAVTSSRCYPTFRFTTTIQQYEGTSLSAAGGSNFSVVARGLQVGGDFHASVRSSDGRYSQIMDRCKILNSTFATCQSSPWNSSADDNATIAFVDSASDFCNATNFCLAPCVQICSVQFKARKDGHTECLHKCATLSPPGKITIQIYEVFSEIFNTIGSVWGGAKVSIAGWGFRSGGSGYTCIFGNATNHTRAVVRSHNQLTCTSAPWPVQLPARQVFLKVTCQNGSDANAGDFLYQSSAIASSAQVSDRIVGHKLLISGGGFDPARGYACQFTAAELGLTDFTQSGAELQRAQVAKTAAMERVASLPADTSRAPFSCKCPGGCRVLSYGSFSDGSQGSEYGTGLDCYWVLESYTNASSIKIYFSEFDVESPWDYVGIYTCSTANPDLACSDAELFQSLTGHGLPTYSFLVVPSSRVLVTFETDDLLGAQGFTAHFEPYSRVVEAVYEKGDMLSCVTPSWDLSTPSLLFQEQTTHMHVVESHHEQSWFGSPLDSKNGRQLLQDANLVRFVHINREPWFWGHDVHINTRPAEHGYSLPTWAGVVSAGVDRHDKVPLPQEDDQLLTFDLELVSSSAPHLFASAPRLSRQGSLEFRISADQFGEALIRVRLSDNGGSESFAYSRFPPIPSTVRLFKINVYAPSASSRTVDFTIPSNITIYEGSGKHILPQFVEDFTSGVPHPQVCSQMVAHDHHDC